MDEQNADRAHDMDELKTRLMKENAFLKSMASKPMSVYFDAYRTKAYDGGGEENLTFQVSVFFVTPLMKTCIMNDNNQIDITLIAIL